MLHCGDTLTCVTDPRTEELKDRLQRVHQRIETACAATGRPDRPELIVVTKYFPAADVQRLYQLGVRQVGENKDQEAAVKAAETALSTAGLNWHFIGQLQSNKAKSVARYASAVHSVDRSKLITALAKAADQALQEGQRAAPLDCLIQVDLRTGSITAPSVHPFQHPVWTQAIAPQQKCRHIMPSAHTGGHSSVH